MKQVFRILIILVLMSTVARAQNSTKKQRVTPNETARKIGTAVKWSDSLESAQALAKKSGKPLFWYISTVPGTFMDRKPVVDRYMLGGPFSWPPIIKLLNEHFVPVRQVPPKSSQELGIKPYEFVEPGFLIISPNGKVVFKMDRLTTFHYGWLENLLVQQIELSGQTPKREVWSKEFARFSGPVEGWIDPYGPEFKKSATNLLLSGMIAFRKGNHDVAKKRWELASTAEPDHPLAWKAALEAQGIGPFCRGFESYRTIPRKAYQAGVLSAGSAAPPETYDRDELVKRSVQFLLGMQRADGAFVDSDYDFGGHDSLPNVHVAVSSLAGMALLRVAQSDPQWSKTLEQPLLNIASFVSDPKNINPADRDEILWAHAYRLRFLSRLAQWDVARKKIPGLSQKHQSAIKDLESIQLKTGNWYHEYNNPFVTATALCALNEAKEAGGKVDKDKIEQGIKSLLRDRFDNGAYPYYSVRGESRRGTPNEERMLMASAGRMPLCELALVLWEEKNQKELTRAVANSLEHHRHLASGYKYDNHTSNMAYGGFFFWYDMRSRSEAIRHIENANDRDKFQKQHQALIDRLPELDGCFIDSHELGRCYGTAMALLSME